MKRVEVLLSIALMGALGAGCFDKAAPDRDAADGDDVAADGDDVAADGDDVAADGDDVAADGDDVAADGDDTADGDGDAVDGMCVPDCTARACGDDGCGGSCGECAGDTQCSPLGQCLAVACIPSCGGRDCGDDGCGGSCGACAEPTPVCADGVCVAACVPACGDRACGDDGCGGSCGACGAGSACSDLGACVPTGWTCAAAAYDGDAQCDCGCGAPDPDCDRAGLAVIGCDAFDLCVAGECSPRVPAAWTCDVFGYDDGVYCHCGCGALDPDCADRAHPLLGCGAGEACGADGACAACEPDCDGRVCGNDGCGGSCGACPDPAPDSGDPQLACVDGACVDGCAPTPALCLDHDCGDDGCGGSCGTCGRDAVCIDGRCTIEPGKSCADSGCGVVAPGGCGCDAACIDNDDCCPDYGPLCTCTPRCDGRVCGDDGCGGSCGSCSAPGAAFCGPDGQCQATCAPSCVDKACGDDGCGGQCGTCGAGERCNGEALCVPADWTCADGYYGEGAACDCGCGAPDPDCETIGLTFNCPLGAACDAASGRCDVALCTAERQCPGAAACVGVYPAGGGALAGVCQAPSAGASPVGTPCATHSQCASELCVGGICRAHCRVDGDCDGGRVCVGAPLVDALDGRGVGVVGVCDKAFVTAVACARQSDCADGPCLALVDATSHAPLYRCGTGAAAATVGAACDPARPCGLGLMCAGERCVVPCPGGQADCPADATCGPALLHDGGTAASADDVTIDACVPR